MAFLDLHNWALTTLFAALLAASLSLQNLPVARGSIQAAAVCEKPLQVLLPLH
jgi:hypothetical protein